MMLMPSLCAKMGCIGTKIPSEDLGNDEKVRKEMSKRIEKQIEKDKKDYRATHRLLLLGTLRTPPFYYRAHFRLYSQSSLMLPWILWVRPGRAGGGVVSSRVTNKIENYILKPN